MGFTNGSRRTLGVPLEGRRRETVAPGLAIAGALDTEHPVVKSWLSTGVILVSAGSAGDARDVRAAQAEEAAEAERRRLAAEADAKAASDAAEADARRVAADAAVKAAQDAEAARTAEAQTWPKDVELTAGDPRPAG